MCSLGAPAVFTSSKLHPFPQPSLPPTQQEAIGVLDKLNEAKALLEDKKETLKVCARVYMHAHARSTRTRKHADACV